MLQERKTSGYDLRSALKNQRFIEECKILVEKCYESVFVSSKDSEDIVSKSKEAEEKKEQVEEEKLKENEEDEEEKIELNPSQSSFTENLCLQLEKEKLEIEDPCVDLPVQATTSATSSKRYKS